MSEIEFLNFAIENWLLLVPITFGCVAALWLSVRDKLVGGIFDPFTLIFVVAFGINYGIVVFIFFEGLLDGVLFGTLALYAVLLITMFRWGSSLKGAPVIYRYLAYIGRPHLSSAVFTTCALIYGALSLLIFSQIGFGILAETNRFDAARGYGAFIRVLDCLSPFIVAYTTLTIMRSKHYRVSKLMGLAVFILYAAVVNGAKISVIYSFSTALLALSMASYRIRISGWQAVVAAVIGLAFSALALNINLEKNNVSEQSVAPLAASSGLLTARLIYRFIAFGDTSYLLLPNRIIDNIQKDSVGARFAAPIIGNDNLSKILGYDVEDYSVGRQALLHYNPNLEVSGGPTSHFDLFFYVYFGSIAGIFLAALLGYILGRINQSVRLAKSSQQSHSNIVLLSIIATLWTRSVLLIIEPTVALAYIFDIFLIFTAICLFVAAIVGVRSPRAATTSTLRNPIL